MSETLGNQPESGLDGAGLQPDVQPSAAAPADGTQPEVGYRCVATLNGPKGPDGKLTRGPVCGRGQHPMNPGICAGGHPWPGNQLGRINEAPAVVDAGPIDISTFNALDIRKADALSLRRHIAEQDAILARPLTRAQRRKERSIRAQLSAQLSSQLEEVERLEALAESGGSKTRVLFGGRYLPPEKAAQREAVKLLPDCIVGLIAERRRQGIVDPVTDDDVRAALARPAMTLNGDDMRRQLEEDIARQAAGLPLALRIELTDSPSGQVQAPPRPVASPAPMPAPRAPDVVSRSEPTPVQVVVRDEDGLPRLVKGNQTECLHCLRARRPADVGPVCPGCNVAWGTPRADAPKSDLDPELEALYQREQRGRGPAIA